MSVTIEKVDLSLKYTAYYKQVKEELFEGSSDILNAQRSKAFQSFVMQGIPTRKNEDYKYTNLHPSFAPEFAFVHSRTDEEANLQEIFRCDVPQLNTTLAFVYNGWFSKKSSAIDQLPEGVILDSLENISKERPELLSKYASLANPDEDPMVAMNTAFAKDGFFLFVPKGVVLDKAIQIINLMKGSSDLLVTQRNYICVEEGAKLQLLLCDHSENLNNYLSNSVTEVFAGSNAEVEFYAAHVAWLVVFARSRRVESNSHLRLALNMV